MYFMRRNNFGKVLVVFLVIVFILLMSLSAISIFVFRKEMEKRQFTEKQLDFSRENEEQLKVEIVEFKKKNFLLEEKNKEADERVNGLLDEIELTKGLREELKEENNGLKQQIEEKQTAQEDLRLELTEEVNFVKGSLKEMAIKFDAESKSGESLKEDILEWKDKHNALKMQYDDFVKTVEEERGLAKEFEENSKKKDQKKDKKKKSKEELKKDVKGQSISNGGNILDKGVKVESTVVVEEKQEQVEGRVPDGRVLNVDVESDFIIINLGEKDGITMGIVLAVYRGDDYLGDIKVTRVQKEMSAADPVVPISSKAIHKNDKVVIKE